MQNRSTSSSARIQKSGNALLTPILSAGIALMFTGLAAVGVTESQAQLNFTNIISSSGLTPTAGNVSVVDFDVDGLEDLAGQIFVGGAIGQQLKLHKNNGDGTFSDVTALWPGLEPVSPERPAFTSWCDYDNDGDPDVALLVNTSSTPLLELRFFRNDLIGFGTQSFSPFQTFAFDATEEPVEVACADYDNDGDLDAFVGRGSSVQSMLLKNNFKESGSVSFTDVAASAGLLPVFAHTYTAHWVDADNDGDMDLMVVNDAFPGSFRRDVLYRNLLIPTGTPVFEDATSDVGLHTATIPSTYVTFGDYDNDGDQDAYFGLGHFTANRLYRNDLNGSLSFAEVAGPLGVQQPIDGGKSLWGDLDNDGDLDLLAGDSSNQHGVPYRNNLIETGSSISPFSDVTPAFNGVPLNKMGALLFFDMENDGDLDIFMGDNGLGVDRLFRNDTPTGNSLSLKLVGTESNRDGVGARVQLTINGQNQHRQVTSNASDRAGNQSIRVHFGLGNAMSVDELKIYWPSGCVQTLTNVPAGNAATPYMQIVESCIGAAINIKPGSDPNTINTCSGGTTPVTIWGSDALDVTTIDPNQLVLASATVKTVGKSERTLCNAGDEGAPDEAFFDSLDPTPDGFLDLTCHFITFELTELDDNSTTADLSITGCNSGDSCQTGDPGYYQTTATDSVNIVKDC